MKKDKKSLLIKFILISLPLVLLIAFTSAMPMAYMSREYVLWKEEMDYVNLENMDPATRLIIGDSRAKSSVIPGMLDDSGDLYNIGIGGATPIEMYYACHNYIRVHGAPQKAVLIFAPYHFCDIDNWDQTLFNNYLTVAEIAEVYKKALMTGEDTIARKGAFSDILSYKLRLPSKYLAQIYDAHFTGNKEANREKYDSIRKDLGYCEFGSDNGNDGENYEVHHEYFDSSEIVLYYYDRLLTLLTKNGTQVTVLQAPVNEASDAAMHKEFLEGYGAFLEKTQKDHPDVRIMKELPVYENRYFGDNNHLNRSGAEKYTEWLKDEGLDDAF